MKIGILTFHRAHNYGAVLQAFALKEYLSSLCDDIEIVDYIPPYFESSNSGISFFKYTLSKSPVRFIKNLLFYPAVVKRNRGFMNFISKKINPSIIKYSSNDVINNYDILIYGSDQIWNGKHTMGPDNIFWGYLTNPKTKRISYASSSSAEFFNEGNFSYVSNALQNFDYISVRENTIKKILQKYTLKDITLVVDPVLLLSKKEWESKLNLDNINQKYVLVYQIRENPLTIKIAKEYAKKNDLKIVILTKLVYQKFNRRLNQTATPIQFVNLIRNADLVVTTSFHGTVFSLVFRKNFYTVSINSEIDERSLSVLSSIGLTKRLVNEMPIKYESIKYNNQIVCKLNSLIEISKDYLRSSII